MERNTYSDKKGELTSLFALKYLTCIKNPIIKKKKIKSYGLNFLWALSVPLYVPAPAHILPCLLFSPALLGMQVVVHIIPSDLLEMGGTQPRL